MILGVVLPQDQHFLGTLDLFLFLAGGPAGDGDGEGPTKALLGRPFDKDAEASSRAAITDNFGGDLLPMTCVGISPMLVLRQVFLQEDDGRLLKAGHHCGIELYNTEMRRVQTVLGELLEFLSGDVGHGCRAIEESIGREDGEELVGGIRATEFRKARRNKGEAEVSGPSLPSVIGGQSPPA
jgi:hypothetical protein